MPTKAKKADKRVNQSQRPFEMAAEYWFILNVEGNGSLVFRIEEIVFLPKSIDRMLIAIGTEKCSLRTNKAGGHPEVFWQVGMT